MNLIDSLLGKKPEYKDIYDPTLLFPISRQEQRKELGIDKENIPFFGVDIWNAYEISWLNLKGKPQIVIGEIYIPADSEYIIESKSLKLYLNSFNNSKFASSEKVKQLLIEDLSRLVQSPVKVALLPINVHCTFGLLPGQNIDHFDIDCINYLIPNKQLIKYQEIFVKKK